MKAPVLWNMQRNAVAKKVAEEIARVTPRLCKLQRNEKLKKMNNLLLKFSQRFEASYSL